MGSNPIGTSLAFVAQSVERRTFNLVVAGSSPAESIYFFNSFLVISLISGLAFFFARLQGIQILKRIIGID